MMRAPNPLRPFLGRTQDGTAFFNNPTIVVFTSAKRTDFRFPSHQQTATTQDFRNPSRMKQNPTNLDTRTLLPI